MPRLRNLAGTTDVFLVLPSPNARCATHFLRRLIYCEKKPVITCYIVTTSSPFFSTMIKQNGLKSKPVQLLLAINWPSRSREKSGPTALFTFDVFSAGRGRDGRRFTSWNIFSIEGVFFFASIHPVRLFSDVWRNMKNSRMGRTRRIKRQQSRARVFRRTLLVLKNVWSIGRVCPASCRF